jgi:large subunit ribosomal protein L29
MAKTGGKLLMKDLLGKSLKELVKLRNKLRKELFEYGLKNSLRGLTQTHVIRLVRRNIARINTAITAKQRQLAGK